MYSTALHILRTCVRGDFLTSYKWIFHSPLSHPSPVPPTRGEKVQGEGESWWAFFGGGILRFYICDLRGRLNWGSLLGVPQGECWMYVGGVVPRDTLRRIPRFCAFRQTTCIVVYVCTGWEEEPYEMGGRKIFERNYAGSLAYESRGAYLLER